jgi:hemerythrin-like domain-containing protein
MNSAGHNFIDIFRKESIMGKRIFFSSDNHGRRRFLRIIASSATLVFAGCSPSRSAAHDKTGSGLMSGEQEVSPGEDLMREHGALIRILLVYGEAVRRLKADENLSLEVLMNSASIIRSFIEDYHEKLEENFLFPLFRRASRLADLVDVLQEQHRAGRRLTDVTLRLATLKALKDPEDRRKLVDSLQQFIWMYTPHLAREDTILFPALHEIVTANEYDKLGENFEQREEELFGEGGFEKMVDRVATIEKSFDLYDLKQFTPKE